MTGRKKPRKASRSKRTPATQSRLRLSKQQALFVGEYLSVLPYNATAAYARAGYKATGAAARTGAARLLKQPAIQAAIDAARAEDASRYAVSRESVLAEYAKIAFGDVRKLFRDDGGLKHPTELDDRTAALVQNFEVQEEYEDLKPDEELEPQPHGGKLRRRAAVRVAVGRTAKVKLSDKRAALDSIVRMMGYAKDNSTLGTPQNPIVMMLADMAGRKSALTPVIEPGNEE